MSPDVVVSKRESRMANMVGFRNTAIHRYQELDLDILRSVVERHLGDFEDYFQQLLQGGNR